MCPIPATAAESAETHAFADMEGTFRLARERSGGSRRLTLALGGGTAAIEVVGDRLFDRLTPAFSHLAIEPDGQALDLSVSLWDADESGLVGHPPAPGNDPTAPAIVSASSDGRFVLQRRTHAVVVLDRARRAVVGSFRDVDRMPLYDRGRPLHPQILLWNQDRGAPPLHAGLVARSGRGALLVGQGGSGKTTATLACLLHGFDFLGDDYISLRRGEGGAFVGHGVYGSTHVDPDHLARFPELFARAVFPQWAREDKAVVFLAEALPQRLTRASSIDALFLPTVKAGRTAVRPAPPAQASLRLVQGALALAPHAGSGGMELLFELASVTPAFWLDLGTDLDEIPPAIAATLDALP